MSTQRNAANEDFSGIASDPLEDGVAVVGAAIRFPGADGLDTLWDNLRSGRDTISRFSEEELNDSFSDEIRRDPNFVRARSVLQNVDMFDPAFFGMQTREAALTDPQHRLLLELSWAALEDAAVDPERYEGPIGMFAGVGFNTYFLKHVLQDRRAVEEYVSNHLIGEYPKMIGSVADFSATKVSYKLGLTGPAMSIGAGCSTSLLTIAQACQSLQMLQCDMALAGGSAISFPQNRGYLYTEGGIASRDGYCRPYDANAVGTVFGHGAGVVALKRLDDAIADGDRIYAVIGGYGVSNDGKDKVGYTAPSVAGQVAAMSSAYAMAGFDPRTIGYVEGHGTATPLGDPIEFEALSQAFSETDAPDDTGYCYLGSGKANYGHLDSAAGVAGFIKAALTVKHGEIPPLAHFQRPNPNIDLSSSPFKFNAELQTWERGAAPRRAAVNALGVGGTNVHVALEEPPATEATEDAPGVRPLILSARTKDALAATATQLADRLEGEGAPALADVAYTLQEGRHGFDHRAVVAAGSAEEAARKLRALRPTGAVARAAPRLAMMFPGQGAQHPDMGRVLYDADPAFKMRCDVGFDLLNPLLGVDLREMVFGDQPSDAADHPIRQTMYAQPALYVIEYAMAQYWIDRGLEPDAMIGHSVGEYVAATLAGVFSFEDGVKLIAARGKLMQEREPGAMLSVRLSEEDLRPLLVEGSEIAAINAPTLCVAAGPFEAIEALEAVLSEKEMTSRRLHTSHAFHSAMMDDAVPALEEVASEIALAKPEAPFISCVTGDWITDADATSPSYWGRHLRAPVRFADGLKALLAGVGGAERGVALLEAGPGRALSTFASQLQSKDADAKAAVAGRIESMPDFAAKDEAESVLQSAIGGLWAAGVDIDWTMFGDGAGRKTTLPTYPFERKSCWIEAPAFDRNNPNSGAAPTAAAPANAALEQIAAMTAQYGAAPAAPSSPAADASAAPVSSSGTMEMADRKTAIVSEITSMLEDLSGDDLTGVEPDTSFLELGFDSLLMGQVAQRVKKSSGVNVTFRQILSDYPTIAALADHVDAEAPADKFAVAAPAAPQAIAVATPQMPIAPATAGGAGQAGLDALIRDQLAAMQQMITAQLAAYGAAGSAPAPVAAPAVASSPLEEFDDLPQAKSGPSRFELMRGGTGAAAEITPQQRAYIDRLISSLCSKMPSSKEQVQRHRAVLSDPRTAAGFREDWKQLVFPIVSDRSKGSKIWDVDGNEYVDLVSGYGQTFFGHSADFVVEAVKAQADKSFAIGPQTPLAFECAQMFAEMTKTDRVTFCNTGSEAVMAAMRVARAHTGREKVVVFSGDYHGQFDEVLVKPGRKRALPMATGIPDSSVNNMVVLPYGHPDSAAWIQKHIDDIAAVIVEPVQSRNPDLRPFDFVRDLRRITEQGGAALVMDEVVTGFRVHLAGMQEVIGVKADMATYGKVLGGGMPLGILAGKPEWMDVLDGGHWSYDDDSVPEVAPTFFAGTFVRHPLVLAATRAVLLHLNEHGQPLLDSVADKAADLAAYMNGELEARGVGAHVEHYSSWIYFYPAKADPLGSLFFPTMRDLGVNMQEGFGSFLTTAHSAEDLVKIKGAFSQALDMLQEVGVLTGKSEAGEPSSDKEATSGDGSSAGLPNSVAVPVPAETAKAVKAEAPVAAAPIALPEKAPLTKMMTEVLATSAFAEEANCCFNEGVLLEMRGSLNADALRASLNRLTMRHEAMRMRFDIFTESMSPVENESLDVPLIDATAEADPDAALQRVISEQSLLPFDYENGPVVRAQLMRLAADRHVLVLYAHHLVLDGWSFDIVLKELAEIYREEIGAGEADLPPVMPLRQYAIEAPKANPDVDAESYWIAEYKDNLPEPVELPTDRPRPVERDFRGKTCTVFMSKEAYHATRKAGAKLGATPFATFLGLTQILMGRLSGATDIPVHIPSAGQVAAPEHSLVGHAVHTLPFRTEYDLNESVGDFLKRVQQKLFQTMEHQDYTLASLVEKLKMGRTPGRAPIADVNFNLERVGKSLDFGGLETKLTTPPRDFVNLDMVINMLESADGLQIDVHYATDLFDHETIERWLGHLGSLAESLVADPRTPIGLMSMLDSSEQRFLIEECNDTARPFRDDVCAHELFAEHAAKAPHLDAVRYGDQSITYGEMERRANQLANRLRELAPGDAQKIGVCLPRGVDYVVAIFGAMKAGHAYIAMDPDHPTDRRRRVLEIAEAPVLICADSQIAECAPDGVHVLRYDQEQGALETLSSEAPSRPEGDAAGRAAYVIFTSGSTGEPKGVEIPHRALVNLIQHSVEVAPGFGPNPSSLGALTFSFDGSIPDFYMPLLNGGVMEIAPRETVRDGFEFADFTDEVMPDYMFGTPSVWRVLIEAGWTPKKPIKKISCGEPLPYNLAVALSEGGAECWNMYGPTEATVWCSGELVDPSDKTIAVGLPISNMKLHVLDAFDNVAPIGVEGELVIGGVGLATGYVGRPDLTAKAFVEISVNGRPAERFYRTGDLAKRLPGGRLKFIGRRDHQIKLRGYRIELEEIEKAIAKVPGVQAAAAGLEGDTEESKKIVGYYVLEPNVSTTSADIVAAIGSTLPSYMTPGDWAHLDALPITRNGKLDRKALPTAPRKDGAKVASVSLAPAVAPAPQSPEPSAPENRPAEAAPPRLSDFLGGSRRRGRK